MSWLRQSKTKFWNFVKIISTVKKELEQLFLPLWSEDIIQLCALPNKRGASFLLQFLPNNAELIDSRALDILVPRIHNKQISHYTWAKPFNQCPITQKSHWSNRSDDPTFLQITSPKKLLHHQSSLQVLLHLHRAHWRSRCRIHMAHLVFLFNLFPTSYKQKV